MKEFDDLVKLTDHLLGPQGCPWDQKQTMQTIRNYILEETHELLDALDHKEDEHIQEELGDFFFTALFLCKIAEKEKRFKTQDVLKNLMEKLLRRHPHVFADKKIKHLEELFVQWETIKSQEEHHRSRQSLLDDIPKTLPALARTQKVLKRLKRAPSVPSAPPFPKIIEDEKSLGEALLVIVYKAQELDLDAEASLRKQTSQLEEAFRKNETKPRP